MLVVVNELVRVGTSVISEEVAGYGLCVWGAVMSEMNSRRWVSLVHSRERMRECEMSLTKTFD